MKVIMPQLGETVTEGTVAAWHKEQGDTVEADEVLLDDAFEGLGGAGVIPDPFGVDDGDRACHAD